MTNPTAVLAGVLVGVGLLAAFLTWHKLAFRGESVLVFLVLLIMFIPIRRYTFPSSLPVHLEPYRLVLVLLGGGVVFSLLVDSTWRWRPMVFGWIAALFLGTSLLSVALNITSISHEALGGIVLQTFLLQLSWIASWVIFRLFLTSPNRVLLVLRTLVNAGAVLALSAAYEAKRKKNVFDRVLVHSRVLKQVKSEVVKLRQGAFRPVASAQQAIPLGMLFAMLLPLALWLAFRDDQGKPGRRVWWLACAILMVVGAAATLSRIALLAIALELVTCLILRPQALKALIPLGLAGLIVLHFAIPGLERKIYRSLFPRGGVVAEQSSGAGQNAAGRLYKGQVALKDVKAHLITGRGFGTRIVEGPKQNTLLLDDQYLGRWEETGLVGLIPMVLLPLVPFYFFYRRARRDKSPWGDLSAALAIMMPGISVSWLLYDSFAYAQEIMVFFLILAIGGWLLTELPEPAATDTPIPASQWSIVSV